MPATRIASFILLLATLTGCAVRPYPTREHLPIDSNHPSTLNGTYRNSPTDTGSSNKSPLWNVLWPKDKYYIYDSITAQPDESVEIIQQSNRRLLARLHKGDQVIASRLFKGKMKDNYFSVRRRMHYFGLPFVYLTHRKYKYHIGKDQANQLIIDSYYSRLKWIVVFTGGLTEDFNFYYPQR